MTLVLPCQRHSHLGHEVCSQHLLRTLQKSHVVVQLSERSVVVKFMTHVVAIKEEDCILIRLERIADVYFHISSHTHQHLQAEQRQLSASLCAHYSGIHVASLYLCRDLIIFAHTTHLKLVVHYIIVFFCHIIAALHHIITVIRKKSTIIRLRHLIDQVQTTSTSLLLSQFNILLSQFHVLINSRGKHRKAQCGSTNSSHSTIHTHLELTHSSHHLCHENIVRHRQVGIYRWQQSLPSLRVSNLFQLNVLVCHSDGGVFSQCNLNRFLKRQVHHACRSESTISFLSRGTKNASQQHAKTHQQFFAFHFHNTFSLLLYSDYFFIPSLMKNSIPDLLFP